MNRLIKIDFLFLGFLLTTTILLICSWNQTENVIDLLITRGIIFVISIGFIFLNPILKSSIFSLFRNIYPVLFAGYFYTETVHYNKLFFDNLDSLFIQMDEWLFGFQPSLEFSKNFSSSWFAELMYFGYFSFYFIILGFIIIMYFKHKKFFVENVFKVTFSLLFFYFLFAIFPSTGPQFYFNEIERVVPMNGFIFQDIMHAIQAGAEQPTGAFPSSHVGVTVAILILAQKKLPLFFKFCLPLTVILILSTVYIKAHYAVDAVFGLLIAPIIVYLATIMYNYPPKKKLIN
ncbi:MAG: phosphatase PAP2 family protein [Polaribacter sp.]|nr:phosphatase PAP2 family protein [Polaribacter sp.]MDG1954520.1 phosphatase PAP2 family protein [Polaribacter sp.]